mmetsp:Transcript_30199/g.68666  ORF Transcript_30199/g.68666 Transcript_30199/m.68666 type:complete len:263 (-) Transcript_30199:245-1033(-)
MTTAGMMYTRTFLHFVEASESTRRAFSEEPPAKSRMDTSFQHQPEDTRIHCSLEGSENCVPVLLLASSTKSASSSSARKNQTRPRLVTAAGAGGDPCRTTPVPAGSRGSCAAGSASRQDGLGRGMPRWLSEDDSEQLDVPYTSEEGEGSQTSLPTTLMIRNIPNSVRVDQLVDFLSAHGMMGLCDLAYLPHDRRSKCNRGYSFVNFLHHRTCEEAMDILAGRQFPGKTSAKVTQCSIATVQGSEALRDLNRDRQHHLVELLM